MRKLLTGYAVSYNRRHDRHGYLFQNRYKSIVCEEERYVLELVRYIHLNPVRAGAAKTMEQLDAYPYSGHSAILGKVRRTWQDRESVLRLYGQSEQGKKGILAIYMCYFKTSENCRGITGPGYGSRRGHGITR